METELREMLRRRGLRPYPRLEIPTPLLLQARRRMGLTFSVAVLTAVVLSFGSIVGIREIQGSQPLPPVSTAAGDSVQLAPKTIRIGATVTGTGAAPSIALSPSAVWVNLVDTVVRVNPETNRVSRVIPGPGPFGDITSGFGSLWVATRVGLARHDLLTGRLIRQMSVAPRRVEGAITAGEDALWVSTGGDNYSSILHVDPVTLKAVASIRVDTVVSLAVGEGSVWVLGKSSLTRIDPRTDRIEWTQPIEGFLRGVAVGNGAVWVTRGEARLGEKSQLLRIDPATRRVTGEVDFGAVGLLAVGANNVWVFDFAPAQLLKIDPRTLRIVDRIPADGGFGPPAMAAGLGSIWVSIHSDPSQSLIELQRFAGS